MEQKYSYKEKPKIVLYFLLSAMFFYVTLKRGDDHIGIRMIGFSFFILTFLATIIFIVKRIKTKDKAWLIMRETELELPIEEEWGKSWIIKYSEIVSIAKFPGGINIAVETGEIQEQFDDDDEITTLQDYVILRKMMINNKQFKEVFEELQFRTKLNGIIYEK